MGNNVHDVGVRVSAEGVPESNAALNQTAKAIQDIGTASKAAANDAKSFTERQKEATTEAQRYVKALQEEAATLGMNSLQLKAYKGDQLQLTAVQREAAAEALKRIQRHEEETASITRLKAATSSMAGVLAGAAMVVGAALLYQTYSAASSAAEMARLSEKTGQSAEQLSRWKFAADVSETSIETLARAMQKLPRSLIEAGNPNSEAGRGFAFLGIDPSQLKTQQQAIDAIADAITRVQDPMAKSAALQMIFKRSGDELISFFNNGADGLKRLGDQGAYWAEVSGVTVARSKELKDQLVELKYAQESFSKQLAADVVGPFKDYIEQLVAARKETGSFGAAILLLGTQTPFAKNASDQAKHYREEIERLEKLKAGLAKVSPDAAASFFGPQIEFTRSRLEMAKLVERQQIQNKLAGTYTGDARDQRLNQPSITGMPDSRETRGGGGAARISEEDRFVDSLAKEAETLGVTGAALKEFQASKLALSTVQRRAVEDSLAVIKAHEAEKNAIEKRKYVEKQQAEGAAEYSTLQQRINTELAQNDERKEKAYDSSLVRMQKQTEDMSVSAIADTRTRGQAQLTLERQRLDAEIEALQLNDQKKRSLLQAADAWYIARERQMTEQLKPEWQKMLDAWGDNNRLMRESFDNFVLGGLRAGENAWVKFVQTGKVGIKDLSDFVVAETARMFYRENLAPGMAAGLKGLGSFITGMFSGSAGTAHSGIGPGEALRNHRTVDMAAFAGAPRFHAGVGPGERPAIIRDDESVLTPGQLRAVKNMGAAAAPVVEFNLINRNGQPMQVSQAGPVQWDGKRLQVAAFIDELGTNRQLRHAIAAVR